MLGKFIPGRGKPRRILSDDGANFVEAAWVLQNSLEQLNQQQIHDFLLQKISNGISIFPLPFT